MKILITGGTGLLGTALTKKFVEEGSEVIILTRRRISQPQKKNSSVLYINNLSQIEPSDKIDVIINLAGETISKRWSKSIKQELINSRVKITREILNLIRNTKHKPEVFISGSAIGFYGNSKDQEFIETSTPNKCFTHEVCNRWEIEAQSAKDLTRVCLIRTGIVLSNDGGALKQMLPAFKLGLGGVMGEGSQWMSWIHIDDFVYAVQKIIEDKKISGPVNVVSPNPVTNKTFTKDLGNTLRRPVIMPMPGFLLRLIFGEMAKALLLQGQKVLPKKLLDSGFKFKYPELTPALQNLLGK